MDGSRNDDQMVGRFYTSARRFKQVLGSLPDGTKIPGGPYTYTQIGVTLAIVVLGWLTRGIWGTDNTFGDLFILVILACGVGFVLGKLPASRRNPLKLMGSVLVLLTHPGPGGRWRGRALKLSPRAQRIQLATKTKAKKGRAAAEQPRSSDATSTQEVASSPAEFGSSLNRLLIDHGLLNTERKS